MAVMTYSFARIGAVVAMRVEDYYPGGKRWWVRLHEKRGATKCRRITSSSSSLMSISPRPESARTARPPVPLRGRQDRRAHRQADEPHRCLSQGSPAHGRGRVQDQARLPRVPRDRHHRLSRGRRHAGKRPRPWPRTRARARPSSTIAPATRSRLTRSSGLRFDLERKAVGNAGPDARA